MICLALSQESVKTVRLALQLCDDDELVKKAGSIYRPLLDKHGIITLVKTINSVMKLPNFHFKQFNNVCSNYEDTISVYSDADCENSEDGLNEKWKMENSQLESNLESVI